MADIFRKSQLDKLSSPDKIDKAVEIASPSFWIAILGGTAVIAITLLWSIFGSMPQKVESPGYFITDNEDFHFTSEVNGVVDQILVKRGDEVKPGDVLYTLYTHQLEKEKNELLEKKKIVEAVSLDSTGDVLNSDTQPLIEIKNQMASSNMQVSQNQIMLQMRTSELETQKEKTKEAEKKVNDARKALEDYQNTYSSVEDHNDLAKEAWNSVISSKAALDASENVMQETKDNFEFYSYYQDSSDPEEQAEYEAAYSTYTNAYQTYYSNKTQYDTAMYAYNDILDTYFPDAQPFVAPDKQSPALDSYAKSYNSQISNLNQKYEKAQNDYSNEFSNQSALESEISSIKVQIAADTDGEDFSVKGYINQFETTKQVALSTLEKEIEKYEEKILDNEIKATIAGTVSDVCITEGEAISQGQTTLQTRSATGVGDLVYCFESWALAKKVAPGMEVKVYPSYADRQEYGNMFAVVESVDSFAISEAQIHTIIPNEAVAHSFMSDGPVVCIRCRLVKDPNTVSGYKWSSKKGANLNVAIGTVLTADIITEHKKPITMLIPYLKEKFSSSMKAEESEEK